MLTDTLTRIVIDRLRGVRHADVQPLRDVNVLVGKNNCGKTTVLESILRAADRVHRRHAFFDKRGILEHWTRMRGEGGWEEQIVFRGAAGERSSSNHPSAPPSLSIELHAVADGRATSARVSWSTASGLSDFDARDPLPRFLAGCGAFHPDDGRNSQVENHYWPQALTNRWDKILLTGLQTTFDVKAEQVHLVGNRLMLLFPDYGLPADSLGDGARAALRSLLLLAATRDAPFLIEEPECHQHPGSLTRFARAVVSLARENRVQLFLSTHSDECLRAFVEASELEQMTPVVLHLSRAESGVVTTTAIEPSVLKRLEGRAIDVRSLDLYE